MEAGKRFLVGVYNDEEILLDAVSKVRSSHVKIHECYTPFPVHGLEHALGYKRTRLPIVAFLFAMTGTSLALFMQIFMLVVDWPMIIGGKPFFSFPDFVPVTFELSVLLSAFGMVGTFLVKSDLKPYKIYPRMFDVRSTDDKHLLVVDLDQNSLSQDELKSIISQSGAEEVNFKEFND